VQSWRDLNGKRLGVAEGTVMERFAEANNLRYRPVSDFSVALDDVMAKRLDATIGDAAVAKYAVTNETDGLLRIAGATFAPDMLGFAFPEGSPLREQVNRVLLQLLEDGTYARLEEKYFGEG
ncbi:MAG: transporter substrate-binding domain-containing protein, partial [Pseudomonadota bacterium]